MSGYVDVAERIQLFRDKHPDGSLRPANPEHPYTVETIGDRTFIVYIAAAYRDQDDRKPGIGVAWEPFPGKTNFTRDSELQNAETSAWGRAIVAALAADTKHGIASSQEVQARNGAPPAHDRKREVVTALNKLKLSTAGTLDELEARLAAAGPVALSHATEGEVESAEGMAAPSADSLPPPDPPVTGPCAECGRGDTKKLPPSASGRLVCKDRAGCAKRVTEQEEPF